MILAAGIAVRVAHIQVPARTPDEKVYVSYAKALYERGPGVLPELVREYRARPELHVYPSPTRVGQVWLQWAAMVVASEGSVGVAAGVSFVSSVLLLLLVWRISASFTPWASAVAMLFLAFSPLDLAMYRRAWGDEPFALVATAMLLCFLGWVQGRRPGWIVAFFACALAATLIKETGLFFLALGTLGLMLHAWSERAWRRMLAALACGALAAALTFAIQAAACGGWAPVREALAGAAVATSDNEYMRKYQSGGWEYYARGLGILQPVPMALGLVAALWAAGLGIAAVVRGDGPAIGLAARWPRAGEITAIVVLGFLAIALVYPQKNMRFLSPIYPAIFLLAGVAVVKIARSIAGRIAAPAQPALLGAVVLGLAILAYADHARFVEYFIVRGVPDLATPWFVESGAQGPGGR